MLFRSAGAGSAAGADTRPGRTLRHRPHRDEHGSRCGLLVHAGRLGAWRFGLLGERPVADVPWHRRVRTAGAAEYCGWRFSERMGHRQSPKQELTSPSPLE